MRNPAFKVARCALMWLAYVAAFWGLSAGARATDVTLAVSGATPPPAMFKNVEVYLVSGLKSGNNPKGRSSGIRVTVDRPGRAVVLFLGDNGHMMDWRVDVTRGTILRGIVLTSYQPSPISAARAVPTYAWPLQRAISDGPGSYYFVRFQDKLQQVFGITRLAGAAVSTQLDDSITFNHVDPSPNLTFAHPVAALPLTNHEFLIYGAGRRGPYARFGLEGPRPGLEPASASTRRIFSWPGWTVAEDGGTGCGVMDGLLRCIELESGQEKMAAVPEGRRGTNLGPLAYDSKRRQLAGVYTRGGTYFALFDIDTMRWLGASASISSAWETVSFTYDVDADRYVGLAGDGDLQFLSGDGATLKTTRRIASRLPYVSWFFKDSHDLPLRVIAWGDTIAFVHLQNDAVAQIWEYDTPSNSVRLTYWNQVLASPDY